MKPAADPGAGLRLRAGLRQSQPRLVGGRALSVVAWQVSLRWRGREGGGAWGLVHPLALREQRPDTPGGRWHLVPDLRLVALGAALGAALVLAAGWRWGRRQRR